MDVIIILRESFYRHDMRTMIKFFVLLRKTPLEINQGLLAALEGHFSTIQTKRSWLREIQHGSISVEGGSRPGRCVIACGDANITLLS